MNQAEFQFLADMLKKRSGLTLGADKAYLIESRLMPIARANGLQTLSELCELVRKSPNEALLVEITEAMTTNESSFFRDIKPYEQLRHVVFPMLMQKITGEKRIRIWSAACSNGQEPYTIALCALEDAAKMPGWKIDILGTDLAKKVVDKAKQGVYSQFEAQRGLPIQMLLKYFAQLPDTSWQIKENVRAMVQYKTHNLLEEYAALGQFDIIFLRNVLIYFDEDTKGKITEKMAKALAPHGLLIIGSTESLIDPKKQFTNFGEFRGAYQLKA